MNEIEKRETDRIPNKTRQSTAWSVNIYRAFDEYRNTQIEYNFVPVDLGTTPVAEIKYWRTRFILEVMRGDGKPYTCSIHSIVKTLTPKKHKS